MNVPKYLKGKVEQINSLAGYKRNSWFIEHNLKLKLQINGNKLFRILFHGIQENLYIVNEENKPLVVLAETSDGVKYTLFDGRYYGFEALLIEDNTKTTLPKEHYYAPNEMYEVYLWFNYKIDLDDEYPCENIELIDGRIVKKEDINDLLFDSFGIILRNQNGEYIEVLEMELDWVWNIIIKIKNIIINSEVLIIFLIKSNYVFSISYILPLERFYFLFEK